MNNNPIPYGFAKRFGVLVKQRQEDHVLIAHKPNPEPMALVELRRTLQLPLQLETLSENDFQNLLTQTYESKTGFNADVVEGVEEELEIDKLIQELPKTEDLLESQDDAPIIRLLNGVLTQAIKQQASDIHFETFEDRILVRFRIDGVLREIVQIQRVLAPLLISRIKVMAKLDIAEKRLPQDGRITLHIAGHTVDVRVSTVPASHGERAVLRLLDKKTARLDLALLGMSDESLVAVQSLIEKPYGIILVTGPTGSGKTTSLYAMLTTLNEPSRNILTVEDPIEYDLPGIGQTQVNLKANMTFARGLRAMLRQDPDIVMIGEIRDLETAEIAIQASLTGHLVLSTLHTNTAIGAVPRLRDMGAELFLLSTSIIGLIAQRLVRLLCKECKQMKKTPSANEQTLFKDEKVLKLYEPVGCDECNQTGYRGRTGIYEVVVIDETLRKMIHTKENSATMRKYSQGKTPSIFHDGLRRVKQGETTLEEVLRVTSAE